MKNPTYTFSEIELMRLTRLIDRTLSFCSGGPAPVLEYKLQKCSEMLHARLAGDTARKR